MPKTISDQRIVTVELTQAELNQLLVDRAKASGIIDFDPTRIQVQEADPSAGTHNIIFERSD